MIRASKAKVQLILLYHFTALESLSPKGHTRPVVLLNVEQCRAKFPVLNAPDTQDWAFMDNAGGSLTPTSTIDAVTRYMSGRQVQLGASYDLSVAATEDVNQGRADAASLINAHPDEIVLGASSTINVFVLAQALRATWKTGDAVVITDLDHEANRGAWQRLEATGIEVRIWSMDPDTAELRPEGLTPLLSDGAVKLVCFTHCANVVGTIHDVAALTQMCHNAGAQVCVDGVAYAPHRRIDVRALDVDWYLISLYKVYGPHVGLLYGKKDRLLEARNQNHFFYEEHQIPHKLMPGNVSHELAAGVSGIPKYLETIAPTLEEAFDMIAAHESALVAPLLEFLAAHPKVRIIGHSDADPAIRVPTVAFVVEGMHSSTLPNALDRHKIAIRWGDFYAARAIERWGLQEQGGIIRVSLVHYNTEAEVSRLIKALESTLSKADFSTPLKPARI